MMDDLMKRGEQLAIQLTQSELLGIAKHLDALFGKGAARVENDRVVVRARGLTRRWLSDPDVRFFGGSRS